jgi:DivIVA domain-containing protein
MDQDDPEKRIAELERQPAEPRIVGDPGPITPEQVHNVAFSKPPIGRRGYNEDEVDALLDVVEEQMKSQQAAFPPPPPARNRKALRGRDLAPSDYQANWGAMTLVR